ncbi:MAG: hypothetical protein QOE14_599 [Humisphaera sp.]|nr:hypothetical protein [Humisphaera sp.]
MRRFFERTLRLFDVTTRFALPFTLLVFVVGCAREPVNPSFSVSRSTAQRALKAMSNCDRPLERPVVVLGGYHDPGIGPTAFLAKLRSAVRDEKIVAVTYPFSRSFDDCRRDVIKAIEKKYPSLDAEQTVEVDVIGLSMGGIVARYSATESPGAKRLRIKRLFTVSSPHRGAIRAALPAMSQLHRDLRPDSEFLRQLERAEGGERDYEIIPYVRLGDWIVGPENAAPREAPAAYWVSNPPLQSAHMGAPLDPRIVADIARRLRGEQPLTATRAAKLPAR